MRDMCHKYLMINNDYISDYPNQCYYKDGDKVLNFHENFKPIGECLKIKCRDDYVLGIN